MTISVGSYDDLEPERAQPIDRNPSIPFGMCGESHNWQDYWKERVSDDPREQPFWCDSCYGELIEQARIERRASENHGLSDYQ